MLESWRMVTATPLRSAPQTRYMPAETVTSESSGQRIHCFSLLIVMFVSSGRYFDRDLQVFVPRKTREVGDVGTKRNAVEERYHAGAPKGYI